MTRIERYVLHGLAGPASRGVSLWAGIMDETSAKGCTRHLDGLVHETPGEDDRWVLGHHPDGTTTTIKLGRAQLR